jgi:hypothetical protein
MQQYPKIHKNDLLIRGGGKEDSGFRIADSGLIFEFGIRNP